MAGKWTLAFYLLLNPWESGKTQIQPFLYVKKKVIIISLISLGNKEVLVCVCVCVCVVWGHDSLEEGMLRGSDFKKKRPEWVNPEAWRGGRGEGLRCQLQCLQPQLAGAPVSKSWRRLPSSCEGPRCEPEPQRASGVGPRPPSSRVLKGDKTPSPLCLWALLHLSRAHQPPPHFPQPLLQKPR